MNLSPDLKSFNTAANSNGKLRSRTWIASWSLLFKEWCEIEQNFENEIYGQFHWPLTVGRQKLNLTKKLDVRAKNMD